MPIRSRHLAGCAAIGLVLVVAACDKSPAGPTSPRPPQQPSPPLPVTVVRIELVAPAEIAPGETVQLTATATKSDGSVENVSSQTQWTPLDSEVLQLSATGLATGKSHGGELVTARFGGRAASRFISVLPKGTFRIGGTIKDSGFGLANVMVTVISGVGEGLTTLSGFDGSYRLYGVGGSVLIQAKKDGYLNSTRQIDASVTRAYDFNMEPARPRTDYGGTYTLTITAASPCQYPADTLPDAAKRRVYTANVAQDVGRLTVTLSDTDFIVTNGYGNRFAGFVDATDAVTFSIGDAYYYWNFYSGHFDIVERFNATALMVNGNVTAKGTPQLISGTLAGSILISSRTSTPFAPPYSSSCYSTTHGFAMVRR
jgi:hypothetical protein